MVRMFYILALFCLIFSLTNAQTYDDSSLDFFFSDEVGEDPMMMSRGFISTGMNELHGAVGVDGKEFYYVVRHRENFSVILETRFSDGFWIYPEVVSFSGKYLDTSPFVDPSGNYFYFASNRPRHETDGIANWNIWRCSRLDDDSWGKPELLPFSSENRNEMSVSVDRDGTVYFHADYGSETITVQRDAFDIFSTRQAGDGSWSEVETLGPAINTEAMEQTPAISPDGDCLVFSSQRQGGDGSSDLYVAFKNEQGWTEAEKLGRYINSGAHECCPAFTPNGELLLFSSFVKSKTPEEVNYAEIKKWVLGPGNGAGNIWYVNVSALFK